MADTSSRQRPLPVPAHGPSVPKWRSRSYERVVHTSCVVLIVAGLSACAAADRTRAPQPASATKAIATAEPASISQSDGVSLPPEACTREGAWDFFRQFVARGEVRESYSKIDLKPIGGPEGSRFDGFRIGLVDNRWVYVDPSLSEADYPRLRLDGIRRGDVFRMEYVKAEYAPNEDLLKTYGPTASYTFEYRDDCWALTAASP
jgi:hypothetical protein